MVGRNGSVTPELGLFVIRSGARGEQERIIGRIKTLFDVHRVYEIHWTRELVRENYARFYRGKLGQPVALSAEQTADESCMLLVLAVDGSPRYESRETPTGPASVNVNFFDAAEEFRAWTGGEHIHSSLSADEAEEDELTLVYANGLPVIKKEGPHEGMVQFIGTEGWVGVSRGNIWASDERLLSLEMKPSDTHLYKSDDHRRDFLNCVKTRQRPICDVEIGHSSLTACLLSEIAMRLGRSLEWNPHKEDFVGDEEASALLTREMRGPWTV